MPDTTTRAQEIRAELNELAPFPAWGSPITALSVAKYLDVQAQSLWARHIVPFSGAQGESLDPKAIMQMNASFAAAHALRFFYQFLPQQADEVASQIAEAWNDGGGTGEWLYEHLGDDAEKIAALAEELAVATKPAAPAGVLVDPEDLRVLMRLAEDYAGRDPLHLTPDASCREALDRLAVAAGVKP